jgi:hypothetical protein
MHLITPRPPRILQAACRLATAALWFSLAGMLPGCQKPLDPQEYGQVVEGLPKVEGAEKIPSLPEMQGEDKIPKGAERFFK